MVSVSPRSHVQPHVSFIPRRTSVRLQAFSNKCSKWQLLRVKSCDDVSNGWGVELRVLSKLSDSANAPKNNILRDFDYLIIGLRSTEASYSFLGLIEKIEGGMVCGITKMFLTPTPNSIKVFWNPSTIHPNPTEIVPRVPHAGYHQVAKKSNFVPRMGSKCGTSTKIELFFEMFVYPLVSSYAELSARRIGNVRGFVRQSSSPVLSTASISFLSLRPQDRCSFSLMP